MKISYLLRSIQRWAAWFAWNEHKCYSLVLKRLWAAWFAWIEYNLFFSPITAVGCVVCIE